ncbi:DUF4097 family beta strand repeat-containing protein [Siminovitchia sp. FSL W7-1587]|uniref:DUF4097 family beta strand repeat-containing protein n=1 Tax=Siminovitchia sp. FSL W7-1587 TaxID=2954699 RepID=UPI0030D3AEED
MTRLKKLAIIASLLLVVGVVGSLLTYKSMIKAEDVFEEKELDTENITDIQVDVDHAKVDIVPMQATDKITVELTGKVAKYKKYKLEAKTEGNSAIIKLNERQRKLFNLNFFNENFYLKIGVPEKEYDTIAVEVVNGLIQASGLHVKSGTVRTVNGKIDLKDIQSSSMKASSENGSIHMNEVTGELKGRITNGNISLLSNNLERSIDFASINGQIRIETDQEPNNVSFDVSITNGDAEIFGRTAKDVKFGNGEHLIKLKTINGKVNVNE